MARSRHGARHMAWVRSFRKKGRRSRRKRNPYAVAGPAAAAFGNPRRRRRSHVRHHRRYRRNPPALRLFNLPPLTAVMYGGVGFAGTAYAEGFLGQFVPAEWTGSMLGRYGLKIGSLIGVTWLSRMILGRSASYMVGIGGGVYVLTSAVRDFMPGVIPGLGQPARLAGPLNLAAYRQMRGEGNYRAPGIAAYRQGKLGAPAIGQPNTTATTGATNVVASRFRRFQ